VSTNIAILTAFLRLIEIGTRRAGAAFRFDSSRPLKHPSNFSLIFALLGRGWAAFFRRGGNRFVAETHHATGRAKFAIDLGFIRDRHIKWRLSAKADMHWTRAKGETDNGSF
jgi:hypothetical protein